MLGDSLGNYTLLEIKQTSIRGVLAMVVARDNPPIILGTANFGLQYGVASNHRKLPDAEIQGILNWAQSHGINRFDTAMAYGSAQDLLGKYLDKTKLFDIDSKLDPTSCNSSDRIVSTTKEILKSIGINQLSVLYLHGENLLSSSSANEISKGVNRVLELGLAKKVGVSVYSEEGITRSKRIIPELSVFQVPENICDRRLLESEKVESLYEAGNSFIVRSVFLQGLLLMEPSSIPPKLKIAQKNVQEIIEFADEKSLTVAELCLAYVRSISWVSGIVVGAASLEQLKEANKNSLFLPEGWATAISTLPTEILDPRKWSI